MGRVRGRSDPGPARPRWFRCRDLASEWQRRGILAADATAVCAVLAAPVGLRHAVRAAAPGAFRPVGPPDLESPRYFAELEEVRTLGAAVDSARTPEQTEIARFWADGAGTETPPGHWNSIAREVSASTGNTLEQNARLFALLNVAMADGAICAWDAKYTYNFWRPVTAIRASVDPAWSSFIPTPPFPDYVSGHSTFSGAGAIVLAMFYGTDRMEFSIESDALPGVTRSFDRFSSAAAEAALSRLYGGIHFRSANEDGLRAGIAIGEWAVMRRMQPKGNRSRKEPEPRRVRPVSRASTDGAS